MNTLYRRMTLIFILLLITIMGVYSAPSGTTVAEHVITVDMVVNDVLYAGFSPRQIRSFQPVEAKDDLSTDITTLASIPQFKESGDTYVTTAFYVYGIVSSNDVISISLDFGSASKHQTIHGTNVGQMYSVATDDTPLNTTVPNINVYLKGADIMALPKAPAPGASEGIKEQLYTLPLKLTVNATPPAAKSRAIHGTTEPTAVNTNYVCSDMLWLEIKKDEFDRYPGIAGHYRAELVLTVVTP